MQSNFLVHKTEKAVVVANYHSPDFTYEKISTETVKCGAIVEVCQGRFSPFSIRVWLNVKPIFGRILWQRICVSEHFCVNLTSWLFKTVMSEKMNSTWRTLLLKNCLVALQHCKLFHMLNKLSWHYCKAYPFQEPSTADSSPFAIWLIILWLLYPTPMHVLKASILYAWMMLLNSVYSVIIRNRWSKYTDCNFWADLWNPKRTYKM